MNPPKQEKNAAMRAAAAAASQGPGKAQDDSVAKASEEVGAMMPAWDMVEALMSGTSAMRAAGVRYLPKFPKETPANHSLRLNSATLRPAFSTTIERLVAKPFAKLLSYDDDFPPEVKKLCDDIDTQGRNLTVFAAEVLETALSFGQAHIFVDTQTAPAGLTVEQERALGIRPYFVLIKPKQLLGWKTSEKGELLQVRWMERVTEDDGAWGVKKIDQVRVIEPGRWSLWRKERDSAGNERWVEHDSGTMSITDTIPLVTVYGRRTGILQSKPPLMELAHLNVKHWQCQSDQDNLMRIARVPILTVSGVDNSFEMTVGSQAAVKLPMGAAMAFVEHSGSAISSGQSQLDALAEEMVQSGAQMLVVKPQATATGVHSDNQVMMSDLQRVVLGLQDGLNLAISYLGKYMRNEVSAKVSVYNDFGFSTVGEASASVLQGMATAGQISTETLFEEMKRRGILSGEREWEEEKARIEAQGPPPGAETPPDDGNNAGQVAGA